MDARVASFPRFAGPTAGKLSLCFAGPAAGKLSPCFAGLTASYAARVAPVER